MRKLTAIILSVIMLFGAIPLTSFATENTVIMIDDAKDFAKMTDTRSYILTQNIDLGSDFETIESFGGTLDGNGYTVTVPTNAPIFEVISGTVKNLNLTGTVLLEDDDVSEHCLEVNNSQYALGVLANGAYGANIENVHSNVDVTFNQYTNQRVMFGGMLGVAYPYYEYNGSTLVENIKCTTIDRCSVSGSIIANYNQFEKTHKVDSVGGVIALASLGVHVSNTHVSADISVSKAAGYVGGIIALQYAQEMPCFDGDAPLNTAIISIDSIKKLGVAKVTNCIVSGSINHTYGDDYLNPVGRSGGIVGFAQGLEIKACAYVGKSITEDVGSVRTILGYGNANDSPKYNITVDSCIDTLGNQRMISIEQNSSSVTNVITWTTTASLIVNKGNGTKISTISVSSKDSALQTFAEANSSAFSYDDSNKTLSLDTITKPSPDCTHKCTVSTGEDNCLSTGMCNCQNDCVNYITGDPYAGFVQFNNDGTRLRIIMVVSDEELTDTKELKPMELRVTIENQSVSIPGTEFTAYESVSAQGKEYVARDGYYLFGAVFEFAVDMSSASPVVTVTYDGANEPVFMGSVKRSNE